ncbi:MAG: glycosyltransferase family 2 protein [Gemmatimonadaceae bacterium]|nr:glycosyltransferase family 2 protein [Gemmatimonadaceae bacterium]
MAGSAPRLPGGVVSAAGSPEIDVVIVNWNAGRLVSDCIAALDKLAHSLPCLHVIVVDNASTDGSADNLVVANLQLSVIKSRANLGFAGGCNLGVEAGRAPILLFLNPDVIVGDPAAVTTPLDFFRNPANSSTGACGVQLRDEYGAIARTLSPFPTPRRAFGWMTALDRIVPALFDPHFLPVAEHTYSRRVDSIMGAYLMMRREVFEMLGGFSTRFFVYYEDVDLCRRATSAGFPSWFVADVSVMHEGCGTTHSIRALRYFYSTRSRIIYGLRHFSRTSGLLTAAGWLVIDPLVRILYSVATFSFLSTGQTLRGAAMLWRDSVNFMKEGRV